MSDEELVTAIRQWYYSKADDQHRSRSPEIRAVFTLGHLLIKLLHRTKCEP